MLVSVFGREASRNFKSGNVKSLAEHIGEANLPWFLQDDAKGEIRAVPRGLPTLMDIIKRKGDAKLEKEAEKYEKNVISKYLNPSKEVAIDPTPEAYLKAMVDQA